jgi:hypothetical protein
MTLPEEARERPNHAGRKPASPAHLRGLLRELDINLPGSARFKLVSRWAAKHVWRVDVDGAPFAFIRYLLGTAEQYPDRWQHMRLSTLLHEARVGPRILGLTPTSAALEGRAAIVEAALQPIPRADLEARSVEAITLFARLHTSMPILAALSGTITLNDRQRFRPFDRMFVEVRERWFEAVVGRWLEAGLSEIGDLTELVGEMINAIETLDCCSDDDGIIVPTHNDPNHGNFMVNRQGALRMIDFEELALNNPVADLGVFLTWYVDRDRHRELLTHYPLGEPDDILERMRAWVPLRYLTIAAHWAARLPRSHDEEAWKYAVASIEEWLTGAAELVYYGPISPRIERTLQRIAASLRDRWPLAASPITGPSAE